MARPPTVIDPIEVAFSLDYEYVPDFYLGGHLLEFDEDVCLGDDVFPDPLPKPLGPLEPPPSAAGTPTDTRPLQAHDHDDSMPQTRRRSVTASTAQPREADSSPPPPLPGTFPGAYRDVRSSSPAETSPTRTRAGVKRRRRGEPLSEEPTVASASTSASISISISTSTSNASNASATTAATLASSQRSPDRKRPRPFGLIVLDEDPFGDDDVGVEAVNLTGADRPDADTHEETPAAPEEPPPANCIKLAAYQCAICMDDVTNLMVTHCGHLFCGSCLHASLCIHASRRVCPICRQKIELRRPGQAKTARSYFPLELKLMTRNRQGKQPARP